MRIFNKAQCSTASTSGTKKKAAFIRSTGQYINFSKRLYGYVSTSELNMTRILNIVLWHWGHLARTSQVLTIRLSHPPKRDGYMLAGYQKPLWPMQTPEQRLGNLQGSTSWQGPKSPHEALQEMTGKVGWTSRTQEHFPKLSWSSLLAAVSVSVCPPTCFV